MFLSFIECLCNLNRDSGLSETDLNVIFGGFKVTSF